MVNNTLHPAVHISGFQNMYRGQWILLTITDPVLSFKDICSVVQPKLDSGLFGFVR